MGRPTKDASSSTQRSVSTTIAVGKLLDVAFDDAFNSVMASTSFSAAVRSYMVTQGPSVAIDAAAMAEQTPCGPQIYDLLFPQLIKELLEACRWHYSSLIPTDASGDLLSRKPAYLPIGLKRDHTAHMRPAAMTASHAPFEVDNVELERLYRLWSAAHPFAPCVSVANMQLRCASAQAIQCLVVLEARQMCGEEQDEERIRMEYQRAENLFRADGILIHDEGTDREAIESMFLACQASLLFGWHELAHNHPKRGTAYMAVAGQLMGQLHGLVGLPQLNNEAIVGSIKMTSSFLSVSTIWAFSQLDRSTGDLGGGWSTSVHCAKRPSETILIDAVTLICSTLLNNHPKVVSSAFRQSPPYGVQDLTTLALHLYPHIASVQLFQDTDQCDADTQDLTELIRDSVRAMLLLPSGINGQHIRNVENELLSAFCSAEARMMRLVGQQAAQGGHAIYSKLAYERPQKPKTNEALRKTVAAFAYELFSLGSTRVADAFEADEATKSLKSTEWQQICASYSQAYFELLETPSLRTARDTFKKSAQRLAANAQDTSGSNTPGLTWSMSPSPNAALLDTSAAFVNTLDFTTAGGVLENIGETLDDSIYNILWGHLPWPQEEC